MTIDSFSGRYRFLSNFYIEPDGTFVEFEYQRAKCDNPETREWFDIPMRCGQMTPAKAKALGQRILIRPDWEAVKVDIMYELVQEKFSDHPSLARLLKATGNAQLIEGNTWGDRVWGVCNGRGMNLLGAILMDVRGTL